jgi:hypothetical protein
MTVLKLAPSFVSRVDGIWAFQLSTSTILVWSLVLVVVCCCLLHTWQKVFSLGGVPKSIPWAGTKDAGNGPLSRARATLRSFFGMRELIQEGYNKVWRLNWLLAQLFQLMVPVVLEKRPGVRSP